MFGNKRKEALKALQKGYEDSKLETITGIIDNDLFMMSLDGQDMKEFLLLCVEAGYIAGQKSLKELKINRNLVLALESNSVTIKG
tara:strand:+ start:759 stop:1013 length:255 start_codon:yes stop_codon:yes gene_type:complete